MAPMFNDWNRAMQELRYVNAIPKHGPRIRDITKALGIPNLHFHSWLTYATYRWPIYEDDKGGVYIGEHRSLTG